MRDLAIRLKHEKTLREKSEIIEGKRVLNEEEAIQIQHNEAEISKYLNKQNIIKWKNRYDFTCFSVFQLDGSASVSNEKKTIELEMNPKEPKLMGKLNNGLGILNTMNVYDFDKHLIEFKILNYLKCKLLL